MSRGNGTENFIDIKRTRGAIQHRHAIEQKARGHGAQHKVFHGGLYRLGMVTAQRHHGVARQRQQLQPHVNNQKIVARDHDEHAQQRKHGQGEHFTATQHIARAGVGAAVDQGHHHRQRSKALEPGGHGVSHHHIAKAVQSQASAGKKAFQASDQRQDDERQGIGVATQRSLGAQVEQGDGAGHGQQQGLRKNGDPAQFVDHGVFLNSGPSMQLGMGHVLQQCANRAVHHVRKRFGVDAHVQNRSR